MENQPRVGREVIVVAVHKMMVQRFHKSSLGRERTHLDCRRDFIKKPNVTGVAVVSLAFSFSIIFPPVSALIFVRCLFFEEKIGFSRTEHFQNVSCLELLYSFPADSSKRVGFGKKSRTLYRFGKIR